jgi:hypothetical protein
MPVLFHSRLSCLDFRLNLLSASNRSHPPFHLSVSWLEFFINQATEELLKAVEEPNIDLQGECCCSQ